MTGVSRRRALPFMLLPAAPGCGAASKDKVLMSDSSGSAILKRIGLVLPPSAKVEYTKYAAGMDDAA